MSGSPEDDELERLREERMEQLQDQTEQDQVDDQLDAQRQQAEAQKQALLRQHLTDGARKRLNTIRMTKPEFADTVERQLLALAQSGRIQGKIDEDKMKELLREMKPKSKKFDIRRR